MNIFTRIGISLAITLFGVFVAFVVRQLKQPAMPVASSAAVAIRQTVKESPTKEIVLRPTATPLETPTAAPTPTPTEKARIIDSDAALKKMTQKVDGVLGITTYYAEHTFDYMRAGQKNALYLLIIKANNLPKLYMAINYVGDGWLFINNYTIRAGDKVLKLTPPTEPDKRVVYGGTVSESAYLEVGDKELEIIRAILDADYAIVRLNGKQSYEDMFIRQAQKQNMRDVLDAYQAMGGKSVFTSDAWPVQPTDALQSQIVGKWMHLSTGNTWEFSADGKIKQYSNSSTKIDNGTYNIPEDGYIQYKFNDNWPIDCDIEIYGDQMFIAFRAEDTFLQFQRIK